MEQSLDTNGRFHLGDDGAAKSAEFDDSERVTVAFERVALRGELSALPFEIRYTTDGWEPTMKSPRYTAPLIVTTTTTVRTAAFCEGKLIASSSGNFTRKPPAPGGAGSRRARSET